MFQAILTVAGGSFRGAAGSPFRSHKRSKLELQTDPLPVAGRLRHRANSDLSKPPR
jgi:hypothetical protein